MRCCRRLSLLDVRDPHRIPTAAGIENFTLARNDAAKWMYPTIPQLWEKHKNGVVGVSDDDPGESYWKIANGIRLTGMPAFNHILSEKEMWQVAFLLKQADSIPPSVSAIFSEARSTDSQHISTGTGASPH
jgi:hypothetical protein